MENGFVILCAKPVNKLVFFWDYVRIWSRGYDKLQNILVQTKREKLLKYTLCTIEKYEGIVESMILEFLNFTTCSI